MVVYIIFCYVGNQGNDCNFEAGICKWTFDSQGKFNWTRYKGSTGTSGTGPKFDHTFGNTGLVLVLFLCSNIRAIHTRKMSCGLNKIRTGPFIIYISY